LHQPSCSIHNSVAHDATGDIPRPEKHEAVEEAQEENRDEEEWEPCRNMVAMN